MKMKSPKGQLTALMWKTIAHSHDEVDTAVLRGMGMLNINESDRVRVTHVEEEIISWRVHLRPSGFLKMSESYVQNIHGEPLNNTLSNLTVLEDI